MTITKSDRSTATALGFEVEGDVTKDDYASITPEVAAAIDRNGAVNLLIDLTGFHHEKISAWGADLRFGHDYHDKIDRLAIVGDKKWQEHLANLSSPWYAKESRYFESEDEAWEWLEG